LTADAAEARLNATHGLAERSNSTNANWLRGDAGRLYDHPRDSARRCNVAPPSGGFPGDFMITLNVNGKPVAVDAAPDTPLLWVLRDYLDLTGTKFGCGMALCGACTVHLDGQPIRSCVTPVSRASGKRVTTIEGLSTTEADRVSKAVQDSWNKLDVVQCGYCQSGQIMAAAALLRVKRKPTDADIDAAMTGNVCRCATYVRIRGAIKDAAKALA
jgi:isoquinoline 1-oxidoreductase alpha subunit